MQWAWTMSRSQTSSEDWKSCRFWITWARIFIYLFMCELFLAWNVFLCQAVFVSVWKVLDKWSLFLFMNRCYYTHTHTHWHTCAQQNLRGDVIGSAHQWVCQAAVMLSSGSALQWLQSVSTVTVRIVFPLITEVHTVLTHMIAWQDRKTPYPSKTKVLYQFSNMFHSTVHSGSVHFKGVIWCDFKFCFLYGVIQADCALIRLQSCKD